MCMRTNTALNMENEEGGRDSSHSVPLKAGRQSGFCVLHVLKERNQLSYVWTTAVVDDKNW